MSERLPAIRARNIIHVLRQLGFYKVRQKGAHIFFNIPMEDVL